MVTTTPDERPESESRVLPLVSDPGNRRMLVEWIDDHSAYQTVDLTEGVEEASFDVCILDKAAFQEHIEPLRAKKKATEPVLLPYLLLLPAADAELTDRDAGKLAHAVNREMIDELVTLPIKQAELRWRLAALLRLREQSLKLRTRERELQDKTEQLKALNRVVRHDIRNDMSVILGWAEAVQDHVTEEGEDALERVLKKSRHVIKVTETARAFVDSLSEEGMAELEPIALDERLEAELAAVRDSHPDANVRVSGDLPEVSVQANEMLSSVFRNLFENAVLHHDEETPTITVTCDEQAETVQIRIADNGPGIPHNRKQDIFGKGEQGLESPGTGIGLYLVHTLTEQFGGDVWIEDNDPKGAIFVVELPKDSSM